MLDGLDAIDWSSIEDAYGQADQIPVLLREIVAVDPVDTADSDTLDEAFQEAFDDLSSCLCEADGSVAEASAVAMPFLFEIAGGHPDPSVRGSIADLLHLMVQVAVRPITEDELHEADARAGVRRTLSTHRATLRELVGDPAVREAAIGMWVHAVRGDAEGIREVVGVLTGMLAVERGATDRFAIVGALDALGAVRASAAAGSTAAAPNEPDTARAVRAVLADPAPAPRLLAALVLLVHDDPASAAWDVVRDALRHPARYEDGWRRAVQVCQPLPESGRFTWVARICAGGADRARRLLPDMLHLVSGSTASAAKGRLEPLLECFFPQGADTTPDAAQSAIAAVLSRHAEYLSTGASEVQLSRRKLPNSAAFLRAYAERGPAGYGALLPAALPPTALPPEAVLAELMERQRGGTTSIRASNLASLVIGDAGSDALLALLPERTPALGELRLTSSPVTARGLGHLPRLRWLHRLSLEDLVLDGGGAAALAGVPRLDRLWLVDVDMDDTVLAALGTAPALTFLCLRGCAVRGHGFGGFGRSTLATLFLRGPMPLDRDGVAAMQALPNLASLSLSGLDIPTDRLAPLAGCAAVTQLELAEMNLDGPLRLPPRTTDLELRSVTLVPHVLDILAEATELRDFSAVDTLLTREHVDALIRCPGLTRVRVDHGTKVTRLREQRPEVDVHPR